MSSRVTFVCHGSTTATRQAAFPLDEPLEPDGPAGATAVIALAARLRLPPDRAARSGPTLRCRQTAELLGLTATVDAGLSDWDLGAWAGRTLDELSTQAPDDVQAWITDPTAAPHGGDPLVTLIERVGGWLDQPDSERPSRLVAVTHPAVIRAAIVHALQAPATAFWRIDVTPLAVVELRGRPGRWSLHP